MFPLLNSPYLVLLLLLLLLVLVLLLLLLILLLFDIFRFCYCSLLFLVEAQWSFSANKDSIVSFTMYNNKVTYRMHPIPYDFYKPAHASSTLIILFLSTTTSISSTTIGTTNTIVTPT